MIYFTAKYDLISSKDSYLFMKFVCAPPAAKVLFFNLPAKNKTKVLIFSLPMLRMNKKQNFMQYIPAEGGLLL